MLLYLLNILSRGRGLLLVHFITKIIVFKITDKNDTVNNIFNIILTVRVSCI